MPGRGALVFRDLALVAKDEALEAAIGRLLRVENERCL